MKPHTRHLRLARPPIFLLLSLALASLGFAASVPIEYLRPMKNSISIGVRLIGGANVTFGGPGLGSIGGYDIHDPDTRAFLLDPNNGYGYIPYDDGTITADSADATSSTPARPSQSGIPANSNGRWQLPPTTVTGTISGNTLQVINGDYLAWDPSGDTTRNWSVKSATQAVPNGDGTDSIDMSTYASNGVQAGQTATAKGNARPGIELQFGRVIQRFKHFEWGFNFTFGISEFNAKNRQTLKANAIKYTDRYPVIAYTEDPEGGPFITGPGALARTTDDNGVQTPITSGPSFTDLPYPNPDYDPNQPEDSVTNPSNLTFSGALENTAPLGIGGAYEPQPVYGYDANGNQLDYQNVDGGYISGYWQVKGVYYLFRLGPMIRVPIGKHFSASVSAGYIAAWVGSKMRFNETLVIPGITTKALSVIDPVNPIIQTASGYQYNFTTDIVKNNQKYLSGAYIDVNFEWWLTTRTGFYVGAVCEKLSNYQQQAYGRVATVKMDDGIGLHFGIMTRF